MKPLITIELIEQYKKEKTLFKDQGFIPMEKVPKTPIDFNEFLQWLQAKKMQDIEYLLTNINSKTSL